MTFETKLRLITLNKYLVLCKSMRSRSLHPEDWEKAVESIERKITRLSNE